VVHSRDDEEIGMAHQVKSPKNLPQFSQRTMGQHWLGNNKPKQAFRSTRNAFKSGCGILKKVYLMEFSTD